MILASGGSPMFPLVVHQPASPSIWPAVQSLLLGLASFYMCGINSSFLQHASTRGLCVLGASCLICKDLVSCYFYFVLLPLGHELW